MLGLARLRCIVRLAAPRRYWLAAVFCWATPGIAAESINLCSEHADVRPWRTRTGEGLNFQLLNRAARQAGVEFKYQTMTWPRCLALLKAGEVDGAFAASFKEDRLEIGVFPGGASPDNRKRLHSDRYVLVRKRGAAVNWNGQQFSHLEGHVGTQLGYSINDKLKKLGVTTDDGAQTAEALLKKLIAGRIAAAAMLEGEVRAVLSAGAGYSGAVEILPTPLEEKPYFLMFSHALKQRNPQMTQKIWDAIESVRQSKDYQREEKAAFAGGGR